MRNDLVEIIWESVEPTLYITKDQFIQSLEGWKIEPVMIDGILSFVTVTKGAHFHFYSLGAGKTASRRLVRQILQKIIDRHGHAATKTPKDDARQRRFNEAIGFKAVGEDEYDIYYRIERVRNAK